MIKTLLIGAPPAQARIVRDTLGGAPGRSITLAHATRLSEGLALLAHGAFDVVLLDNPLVDAAPTDALARVVRAAHGAGIVVLVRPVDAVDGRQALDAGAHAVAVKDAAWELDLPRLLHALDAALGRGRPGAPPAQRPIVSVVGVAGGNGATTTAYRLARQLALSGTDTVLAEARSWPGGLLPLSGVAPTGHLGAFLEPQPAPLEPILTTAGPRLKLLLAPPTERADRELTAERTTRLLDGLSRAAECVVVELPCELTPSFEVACLASALIVLVTEAAPAALRQGRCIVELLNAWSIPCDRISAVAIHRSPAHIADPDSVAAVLGCPVLAVLPTVEHSWADQDRDPAARAVESHAMAPIVKHVLGDACPPRA